MTNEQQKAKELAKLLNAFADGKRLEFFDDANGWCDYAQSLHCMVEEFWDGVEFRIKPETKRIALTMQDLIDRELRKDTMSLIQDRTVFHIRQYDGKYITLNTNHVTGYEHLKDYYSWLDGTPCYKEMECK